MLGYWTFREKIGEIRNYGASGYGSSLMKIGAKLVSEPIDLPSGFYYSFEAKNISGQILEHGNMSFGLIGVKNGVIPYVKNGPYFYKPDNKYAVQSGVNWGVYYRPEAFADKDFTLSIYRDNADIYTNGVFPIPLDGNILFCNTGVDSVRLYSDIPIDPIHNSHPGLFGAGSGTLGSGLNLFMGPPLVSIGSGINLALGAVDSCYLMDEQYRILYDESGNPLLAEGCTQYGGLFAGFDMCISGEAFTDFILPLYLHQTSTTYLMSGSSLPLFLQGGGTELESSINLTVYNSYSSISSGMNLTIDGLGTNDGYAPIGSGFPLFIQRNENVTFDLFISGATTPVSGAMNLYLNGNTYPVSGIMNLSMPYTYGLPNSGMFLYTRGW